MKSSTKISATPKGTWGGKREGAGRPKTSPFVPHMTRPEMGTRVPMQVLIRVRTGFASLRTPEMHKVFELAASRARRFGIRIIEYSLLDRAIHMVCEAKENDELERSFKSLNTTMAIALKKAFKADSGREHKGPVFLGRYHLTMLDSAEKVKAALADVLTKPAQEFGRRPYRDEYSSGVAFERWRKLLDGRVSEDLITPDPDPEARRRATTITASPQFWLTKTGWMKV